MTSTDELYNTLTTQEVGVASRGVGGADTLSSCSSLWRPLHVASQWWMLAEGANFHCWGERSVGNLWS